MSVDATAGVVDADALDRAVLRRVALRCAMAIGRPVNGKTRVGSSNDGCFEWQWSSKSPRVPFHLHVPPSTVIYPSSSSSGSVIQHRPCILSITRTIVMVNASFRANVVSRHDGHAIVRAARSIPS